MAVKVKPTPAGKEWLYVGHYTDIEGNLILKIGTTADLRKRQREHTCAYKRRTKNHPMAADGKFEYDWILPLSPANTLRFEVLNRESIKRQGVGQFVKNDRFNCGKVQSVKVQVKIRKTYEVFLIMEQEVKNGKGMDLLE